MNCDLLLQIKTFVPGNGNGMCKILPIGELASLDLWFHQNQKPAHCGFLVPRGDLDACQGCMKSLLMNSKRKAGNSVHTSGGSLAVSPKNRDRVVKFLHLKDERSGINPSPYFTYRWFA